MKEYGLSKRHKLCSVTLIDALFAQRGGGRSALAYPLRAVWCDAPSALAVDKGGERVHKFLISIPKKRLRRAVDRVRMRRLVREAYRLNHAAVERRGDESAVKHIAFVYVADTVKDYRHVERAVKRLLEVIHQVSRIGSQAEQGGQVHSSAPSAL